MKCIFHKIGALLTSDSATRYQIQVEMLNLDRKIEILQTFLWETSKLWNSRNNAICFVTKFHPNTYW